MTTTASERVPETPVQDPEVRATDFLLFFCLPLSGYTVRGLPLSELAMGVAVLLALVRRPTPELRVPRWLSILLALLFSWMCVVALLQGLTPLRRLSHLALYCLLAVLLARGRFAMRSVARGLATGLVVASVAGLLGFGLDYGGRLTGLLGDPNGAGFYLLALGTVSVAFLPRGRLRVLLIVFIAAMVLLTLSRTSILAMGLIGAWVVLGRRFSPVSRLALTGTLLYAAQSVSERIRLTGPFADRAGSDDLRLRINAAAEAQVAQAPWTGNGPGTSQVYVNGDTFFFHNSYLSLRNEGGWVAVVLIALISISALLALARLPQTSKAIWLSSGLIAVATCAINLGEVLLELPAAAVLGAGAFFVGLHRIKPPDATRR